MPERDYDQRWVTPTPVVNPRTAEGLRRAGVTKGYAIDNERLPRRFGKNGGLFCPVCKMEAERFIVSEEKRRIGWIHQGRAYPCTRAMGQGSEHGASDRSVADTAAGTDGTTSAPEA